MPKKEKYCVCKEPEILRHCLDNVEKVWCGKCGLPIQPKQNKVRGILKKLELQGLKMIENSKYDDMEEWKKKHNEILDQAEKEIMAELDAFYQACKYICEHNEEFKKAVEEKMNEKVVGILTNKNKVIIATEKAVYSYPMTNFFDWCLFRWIRRLIVFLFYDEPLNPNDWRD